MVGTKSLINTLTELLRWSITLVHDTAILDNTPHSGIVLLAITSSRAVGGLRFAVSGSEPVEYGTSNIAMLRPQ